MLDLVIFKLIHKTWESAFKNHKIFGTSTLQANQPGHLVWYWKLQEDLSWELEQQTPWDSFWRASFLSLLRPLLALFGRYHLEACFFGHQWFLSALFSSSLNSIYCSSSFNSPLQQNPGVASAAALLQLSNC